MITDAETNTVFLSLELKQSFPVLEKRLSEILLNDGITLKGINNTENIRCADLMPLQVNNESFVEFTNNSSGYVNTNAQPLITEKLPFETNRSNLILDKSSVVKGKNKVIVTEKFYLDNISMDKITVNTLLKELLEINEVICIPIPASTLNNQAESVVRFLDDRTVLLAEIRDDSDFFQLRVEEIFKRHRIEIILLPDFKQSKFEQKKEAPVLENYMDYLHVGKTIVLPSYNNSINENAAITFEKLFPEHSIHTIESTALSQAGAELKSVAWNVLL